MSERSQQAIEVNESGSYLFGVGSLRKLFKSRRRYESIVPRHLRELGERNGAPRPNAYDLSAQGEPIQSEEDLRLYR